jgi:hypothetical protein
MQMQPCDTCLVCAGRCVERLEHRVDAVAADVEHPAAAQCRARPDAHRLDRSIADANMELEREGRLAVFARPDFTSKPCKRASHVAV